MNGTNGVNGVDSSESVLNKFGLINCAAQKYLTAETFGFKINATGTSLRKKQVWHLDLDKNDEIVYLRSHLGRYLSADKHGNVTCDAEERGDNEKFVIVYDKADTGRWAFRSLIHAYYFGGTGDKLHCHANAPSDTEWWHVHLGVHPQVNFLNVNRKRYCHMKNDEIQCSEIIPWGSDALTTLEYHDGKYAIKTCDNRYLHREGQLVEDLSSDTLYTLEMKSGQSSGLALKDSTGKYVSPVGPTATMKGRNKTVSKDDLFLIEDNHPQVTLKAHNAKLVSIRQGVDVTANQLVNDEEEVGDKETYQLEYENISGKWRFRTVDNKYWILQDNGGIQAVAPPDTKDAGTLFDMEYVDNGNVILKASNSNYVTARPNGSLYAVSENATEKEKLRLTIVNRPILVLKSDHGFVGFKSSSSTRLECNKSHYDVFQVKQLDNGSYSLKASSSKYWNVASDSTINCDSDTAQGFYIELKTHAVCLIKAPNGSYLKGEQNGTFVASASDGSAASIWEY